MFDSFLLSLFFFGFLFLETLLYGKFDFSFLKQGREIRLSLGGSLAIILSVVAIAIAVTYFILNYSGPELLQQYNILLFTLALAVTFLFLIPIEKIYPRIFASLSLAFGFLLILFSYPSQIFQNIFMAASFLWVGPIVFKKFNLLTKYFIFFMIIFMLTDTYNIYFARSQVMFSDEDFFLNGLIQIDDFILGIGDFFLGYLIVSHARREFDLKVSLFLAFLLPLPRFLIRTTLPNLAGATFPYSVFMAPIALLVYWAVKRSKLGD